MKYQQPVGAAEDAPYVDEDPATGQEGSAVPAAAIEHPQREILAVLAAAGIAPDEAQLDQLATAIIALAGDPTTLLATSNEWAQTQNAEPKTLVDATNIEWNAQTHQSVDVTLQGNRTLQNPTSMVEGATYILTVKQDATGGRTLAFGSAYKFPSGVAPTLTADANAIDTLSFVCRDGQMLCVMQGDFK